MDERTSQEMLPLNAIEAYLELSKKINILMREEEVIRLFVDLLKRTMPTLEFCIRLVDEKRGVLDRVYASGALARDVRDRLFLTESAFEQGSIPEPLREKLPPALEILDEAPLIFEGSGSGTLVALADESSFFGTLHVESTKTSVQPLLVVLCFALGHHLTGALRGTKLLNESTSLRDYLSKLIDNANAPIVIIDGRRRIQAFNRTLEQLTGYSKRHLLGTDFLELFDEQDRKRFTSVILKAMKGLPTSNFETRIPRRAGGEAQISFNITSVLDAYGKVEAVIAVGQDLTEIRRLQNQMLHSERLATIGQLSAGVIHEVNNPLTSISVYSEALLAKARATDTAPEDIKRLERIHMASQRIFKFTQQLMTYARPTGEEPTIVWMSEILDKSLGFCEHILYKAGVEVVRNYDENVAPVYGIEGQLEQVFVNLVTNAAHAMGKQGGGRLEIQVESGEEGTVRISVSDEGEGIPPESIKEIFEPFYTTKGEGEGTGLGLSIVKNIITSHDGDITVMSKPGEGTTFTVTLYTSE